MLEKIGRLTELFAMPWKTTQARFWIQPRPRMSTQAFAGPYPPGHLGRRRFNGKFLRPDVLFPGAVGESTESIEWQVGV
jgi:hypothetical protein